MKCIFLILGLLFSMGLRAQAQDLKTLQEKKATFETKGTDNTVDYVQVLIDLSHAHLAEEQLEESREVLMLGGRVIKKLRQELSYSNNPNSPQEHLVINLCNSNYVLVWFKQLAIENTPHIAQKYLVQEDWFNQTILLEEQTQTNFVQLLEIANQYYGSTSEFYLKNWYKIYNLYTSYGTRDRQKAEKMWLTLLEIREEKFGKTSDEYLSILFGCSNFYSRINRTADFQKLKTQVEKSWPTAYEFEQLVLEKAPKKKTKDQSEEATSEEETFTIVEVMPRFPGCEDKEGDNLSKKKCADQNLLRFIYENIKYPDIARENGIEGMSVISFTVSEYGTIVDANILRNPGGATGEESLRLVLRMNELPERWTPGTQTGENVRVKYNLPVRYRLN